MTIEEIYIQKCNTPSDINEHLPVLREIASRCESVTEFGVRNPTSTYAFLMGCKNVVSYDIEINNGVEKLLNIYPDWDFNIGNTLEIEIEETDFLFIDTHHKYGQLLLELHYHADKVRKYIGFHDVFTFGYRDESEYHEQPQKVYGEGPGLMKCINEFLVLYPEWQIIYQTAKNNGLIIIKKN